MQQKNNCKPTKYGIVRDKKQDPFFLGKPDTITFDDKSIFADLFSSFALVLHSFRCFLVFHYNNFAREDITKNFVQWGFSEKKKKGSCFMSRTILIFVT